MTGVSPRDLLACAAEAVRRAGAHAVANQSRRTEAIAVAEHDVKLALDQECQAIIESVIHSAYPSHSILGEEGRREGGDANYRWIVDPLDGTVNFSHALPYWCHSVAVQRGGETLAAAVFAPVFGEVYAASLETPAVCNEEPIRVSEIRTLGESVLLTGLERNFDQHPQSVEVARAVSLAAQKMRLMGAAALDLCQLACGRVEGFYESGIHLWDVAAGEFIIRRAGGRCQNLAQLSEVKCRFLATNGHIHDELIALLRPFEIWLSGATTWRRQH
ncbi:MAG: inositol monophosphatase [Kiritimatiellae bacterium]|nr:inositol monophosphatase [Kiritimatiellia bacterium]